MMEVALTFELANVITQKETDPLPSGLKKGEHEGNTENLVTEIQCLHDHNFFRISQSQSQTEVVNAGADTLDTGETAKADCSSVSSGISQTYLMEPPASLTGAEIVADKNEFDVFDHVGLVVDVSTEEEISRDNDSTSVATSFTSRSGTPSGSVPSGKRKYNIFAEGIGATLDLLVKKFRPGETVSRSLTPDPEDIEETTVADYQPCVSTQEPRPSWATTKSGGGSGGGGASTGHHQSTTKITSVSHSSGNFSFQRGAGGEEMRQLMRKKMFRCTICKNRFIERDLFERHMKERHPKKYEVYMEEKNKREEKERLEYLEFLRIQREREERRNQRLAEIYEERLKLEAEGHNVGPPPLPEDIFPPRPPRPKSPDEDVGVEVNSNGPPEDDGGGTVRFRGVSFRNSVRFQKKVSPQCPFCDKRYRNDNSLRKHIAKKHPDCINFVQCNRCYKALRNADEIPGHHCDLTYICNECQPVRNMVDAERLYNHKQKFHRGEKSGFLCMECNRKFLTPRKLKKHQRMAHVIQKPYKCQFCDEYFPTDMQVCAHERIHTGKVRWECPLCDYRCNRSTKLLDHKKTEHGYLCMLCGEPQPEWNNLKNHTLEKHQGYLSSENQNCVIVSPRIWTLLKGE